MFLVLKCTGLKSQLKRRKHKIYNTYHFFGRRLAFLRSQTLTDDLSDAAF